MVTQSAMAFAQLLGAFSLVINQFQSISSFAAVTARLDALGEAVEHTTAPDSSAIETIEDHEHLAYERLTLREPDGARALVKDLSVSIPRGAGCWSRVRRRRRGSPCSGRPPGSGTGGRGRSPARPWMRSFSCPSGRNCPP